MSLTEENIIDSIDLDIHEKNEKLNTYQFKNLSPRGGLVTQKSVVEHSHNFELSIDYLL
jgi:hypothetical protein